MTTTPNKEQAEKPSSGEEKETPKEEQVTEPSDLQGAYNQFAKDRAEKKEAQAKKASEEAKPPSEEEAEEKVEDSKPEGPKLRFVDEQGNDVSFVLDVDGKAIEIKDPNELKTKGQIWYHHDIKGKELNDLKATLEAKEQELQQGADELRALMEEIKARKASAPKTPSGEEQVDEEDEDEDGYVDPEVRKLRKEIKALKDEQKNLTAMFLMDKIGTEKTLMQKDFNDAYEEIAKEQKFCFAKQKRVMELLAYEKDEKGNPKYKSVKEAVIADHNERIADLKEYTEKDPAYQQMTKEQKAQAVKEYLESKKEDEAAPVGSPSETAAGDIKPTPKDGKEGKEDFDGDVGAAWRAGMEAVEKKRREAKKH